MSHLDFTKTYSLDLVAGNALYELKTVAGFNSEHQAQLLNYLFLLDLPRGKLLNFRPPKVQGRIHANSLTLEDRRGFRSDSSRWERLSDDCCTLRDAMCELLADWGAFLSMKLYEQALVHLCGGESQVIQRMPPFLDLAYRWVHNDSMCIRPIWLSVLLLRASKSPIWKSIYGVCWLSRSSTQSSGLISIMPISRSLP